MEPEYGEGDVVVFSPAAPVTDGCDCFVRLERDGESTFKRVFFEGERGSAAEDRCASPGTAAGDSGQRASGEGVCGGGGLIRLQPLNPQFASRVVAREAVSGLYRAVWRWQKLK
jgi:SOS-response transcriptional repressor LexA